MTIIYYLLKMVMFILYYLYSNITLIYNYISALRDYPIDFYYFKEGVSVYGICFKQRWTTADADEQAR